MGKSSIEWTTETWNPVVGCEKVSPGCKHCYAATMAGRIVRMDGKAADRYRLTVIHRDAAGKRCAPDAPGAEPQGDWNGTFVEVPKALSIPLRRRKPTTFFVNSMSDLFGEGVSDEYIAAVFGVMAATPQHTYQILTKRAERLPKWFEWIASDPVECAREAARRVYGWPAFDVMPNWPNQWPLSNAQIGVSVEDRKHGLPRLDELRKVPAAVRMVSFEPLLEDLGEINLDGIGWVIVGGESGNGARPLALEWAAALSEQCRNASVPYFFKQAGIHAHRNLHCLAGKRGCESAATWERDGRRFYDVKGGDVDELARLFPDLASAGVFRREWPEVSRG